jgi:hypothetical protein
MDDFPFLDAIAVAVLMPLFFVLFYLLIVEPTGDICIIGIILGAFCLVGLMFLSVLDKTVPRRIELFDDKIRFYQLNRLKQEIEFDRMVRATISRDHRANGAPISGFFFIDGADHIGFSKEDGWRDGTIVRFWDPFMEAIESNDLKMGGELKRYLREQRGGAVEPEREAKQKEYSASPEDREKELDLWTTKVEAGAPEVSRAMEVVREAEGPEYPLDVSKLFWHQFEQWHAAIYIGLFTLIPALWVIHHIGNLIQGTPMSGSTFVWGILILTFFGLLVRWMHKMRVFAVEYWNGTANLDPETTFMVISGVLKANNVQYELVHDPSQMPSRRIGQSYRLVSFHLWLDKGAKYLDLAGNSDTHVWFGPITEGSDEQFEKLLYDIDRALRFEIYEA